MAGTYQPTEYLYLSARLRAREAFLVGKERLAQLAAMQDAAQITAALTAEGVFPADTPREEALCAMLRDGFATVREAAPDPRLFAFLQYPYDCHNLKTVLKCHFAGRDPGALLLDVGTLPVSALNELPAQLPEGLPAQMRKGVVEAREAYERTGDPRVIDFILDAACFADMEKDAAALPAAAALVRARAEMTNLRTCRRLLAMCAGEAGEAMLSQAFVPGGDTDREALLDAYRAGEEGLAALAAKGKYAGVLTEKTPAAMDLAMDNVYLDLAKEGARVPFGAEVALGYLVGVEYAVKNLRILLVAKETGADAETLKGRLRSSYV